MRIADLLESLELPDTRVADSAWDAGRRRVRRRRAAGVTGAVAATAATVLAAVLTSGPPASEPQPGGPEPGPTQPTHEPIPIMRSTTQTMLLGQAWQDTLAGVTALAVDPARTVPLSQRPLDRAVLAVADPADEAGVLVLGEDGWWRRVDAPGLEPVRDESGYTSPALTSTSLSPDAGRLALPQPGGLVVVDLASGTSQRYDVPGRPAYVAWLTDTSVYVADENEGDKGVLDLTDGILGDTTLTLATVPTGDDTVTWDRFLPLLDHYFAGDVPAAVANDGGFFAVRPLVGDGVVIGTHAVTEGTRSSFPPSGAGLVVVDAQEGDALAYLPTTRGKGTASVPLGWSDGLPVVGLQLDQLSSPRTFVMRWDWRHSRLEPVASLMTTVVSWGTGRLP